MNSTNFTVFQPEIESVTEFLQRFRVQNSTALESTEDASLKAALLCRALPVPVITDVQRRIKPTLLTAATFEQIEEQLKAQFDIRKSVIGAAVKFINRKQQQGESIENYAKVLNDLASNCNYKECCRDRLLRDIFVSGLLSGKLISALLQDCEDKSFNQCIERAKTLEQLAHDAADIKPESRTHSSYKLERHYNTSSRTSRNQRNSQIPKNYVCIRCGTRAQHTADQCYALDLSCRKCSKKGHIEKMCKSRKFRANAVQPSYEMDEETAKCRLINTVKSSEGSSDMGRNEISANNRSPALEKTLHLGAVGQGAKHFADGSSLYYSTFANDNDFDNDFLY